MVERMLLQRRGGIDAEGVAPGPDQKARLDRLDEPHGGLAGHRAGWNGWRCHRDGGRWSKGDTLPATVHGPLRKPYPNVVRDHERHDRMPASARAQPAGALTIHQSSQMFMVNALLSLDA